MLDYDMLVDELEIAWIAAGLHEHDVLEQVQPDMHERTFKADLFPEHPDPLDEETMPPWVEVSFPWSAFHQLRSEGYTMPQAEPVGITWVYHVMVHRTMYERQDHEFVRLFQKAVHAALRQYAQIDDIEPPPVAVEVRRIYQSEATQPALAYVHLTSPNFTDLSELWEESDPQTLRMQLQSEMYFSSVVIHELAKTFTPGALGNNASYRSVDTA